MKAQQILNIVYMSSLGLVLYTETQLASSVIKFFTYRQLNVNIFAKTTFTVKNGNVAQVARE